MAAPAIPSQVDILKTDAAAKKGLGVKAKDTEAIWPKPQFVSSIALLIRHAMSDPIVLMKAAYRSWKRKNDRKDMCSGVLIIFQSAGTVIDNVTDGDGASGFIVPAGSMFTLGYVLHVLHHDLPYSRRPGPSSTCFADLAGH
jgi:hypothetical protein